MFALEVLNDGGEWEMIAEFFDSAAEAEVYFQHQLGCFAEFRVVELQD